MSGWRIGADVGGTFTDLVAVSPEGLTVAAKVPSTPEDFTEGIVRGAAELLRDLGVPHADVDGFAHGTTVVTNTILERRGGRTALVTTRGFRDVLEIGRMRVPRLYDASWVKPLPLVERDLRFEVSERLDAQGKVVVPLDEDEARALLAELAEREVTALAVCFLHSYANPEHERRFGQLAAELLPGVDVSLSCDVLAEPGEYERTSTTVVNAYVRPVVRDYFAGLSERLAAARVPAPVRVMRSDGGLTGIAHAGLLPVTVIESGPAAGVVAARSVARSLDLDRVLSFDMGGTTAKACLIEDGEIVMAGEYAVGAELSAGSRVFSGGGYAVRAPALDIAEVGAGGGSLLWIDDGGLLRVGPRSAGAHPGPIAYGRGGTVPTLTDANLVLGYLGSIAGGSVPLDREAAELAIGTLIAGPLGLSTLDAAAGARRVAVSTMARALKAVSTERGHDPRTFTLVAFGGNGPGHATELAEALGVRRVVVPPLAGVLSAVGLGAAWVRRSFTHPLGRPLDAAGLADLAPVLERLERAAAADLARECVPGETVSTERRLDLRYHGQSTAVTLDLTGGETHEELAERFAAAYSRIFGLRFDLPVELLAARVVATLRQPHRAAPAGDLDAPSRPATTRTVYFGPEHGPLATRVHHGAAALRVTQAGPCVVELPDSTLVVGPGWSAKADPTGTILMERA